MTKAQNLDSTDILNFWFQELKPKQWWIKDENFDQLLRDRYMDLHQSAMAGELFSWRDSPEGRLAEVIVLDQFSRNMFRNSPEAFASDPLALCLSQQAVQTGEDLKLTNLQRQFLYMPYMHSESQDIHQQAEVLFKAIGNSYDFEIKHKVIIDRFGRYPHRNAILNRESSSEEIEFLSQPASSF